MTKKGAYIMTPQEKEIIKKLNLEKRSCQFILKNEELCDRILKESPIRVNDAVNKYNMSLNRLKQYINNNLLSSFSNLNSKGSPVFIFEEELIDLVGEGAYKKDLTSVTLTIKQTLESYIDIMKIVFNEGRLYHIMKGIILDKKTISELAEDYNLSTARIGQLFHTGMRRGKHYLNIIPKYQDLMDDIEALTAEKDALVKVLNKLNRDNEGVIKKFNLNVKTNSKRLVDLDLSVRTLNCLRAGNIETLGDLTTYHRMDVLKFRNCGKKSLKELDELLESYGLEYNKE